MVLITTTKNIFIIQAIKYMSWRNFPYVKVISVDENSLLERDFDAYSLQNEQVLLIPVFPDNDFAACMHSLQFLNQWSEKKYLNIPCLVWGEGVMWANIGMPTIPWRLTKDEFCFYIDRYICNRRYSKRIRGVRKLSFIEQPLSPREHSIFLYTREGKNIAWISNTLGISSKTVWTHRRRVMDKFGVRRLHQLMNIPLSFINKSSKL
ncbi:LuxR family transcriptional regulator [Salmonella enterica subsp. diarizonae]|uniref:helix-turn-helix transcriptional regulator n=1 Tax=Salmonella enterica TaxID=28901 RepID=UPI0009AEF026|nr:helix-turn-helix transcriptional regulator [Salmonella enterica]EAW2451686.1 LuxR family transcriptional regulator [Salmonella enterica subsp. diarizonae]EHG2955308.1 helix-turn-helix transcriptional regulator [Salmonella enterica subsp. diarizonae serovar 53:r:z35]EHG6070527.1 helix-turn-helix transcriptional regulator [Salmonella enterica subsp. diarizonae serovar 61:z52:z53]ECI5214840.1 LuxR family transcriptional regulator [Salmonella enterica subsp. diarizonae]EDL8432143.1 LuxR family 